LSTGKRPYYWAELYKIRPQNLKKVLDIDPPYVRAPSDPFQAQVFATLADNPNSMVRLDMKALQIRLRYRFGFTLAELLIALAILGEIATFTLPKIINSQQNKSYNAKAKEAAATLTQALQYYRVYNSFASNTGIGDLTQYMNYVSYDSSGTLIDERYTGTTVACNVSGGRCIRLHNGAAIQFWPGDRFGSCTSLHAVGFRVDPDGVVTDGTTNGPGKAVELFIYCDGKVRDRANVEPGTILTNGGGPYTT
jgi:prepilin-type N-terminal cleavage/methylation domain-containing protein